MLSYLTDPAECELLAALCEEPSKRRVFINDAIQRCRWHYHLVFVPGTDQKFTEPESWDYVSGLIRRKEAIRVVKLDTPYGDIGFQMKIALEKNRPELYIKLALNKKRTFIIGRSFHYNDE